jgi:hypothetical protein
MNTEDKQTDIIKQETGNKIFVILQFQKNHDVIIHDVMGKGGSIL